MEGSGQLQEVGTEKQGGGRKLCQWRAASWGGISMPADPFGGWFRYLEQISCEGLT